MIDLLLTPPLAFVIYVALVGALLLAGRLLAGKAHPNPEKASAYASGEEADSSMAVPGYRPFFKGALFFAVLHLGVIVLGSSAVSGGGAAPGAALYAVGLMLALIALILG